MLSHLSLQLIRCFALGTLTGTQVQLLASAAWQDRWGRGDPCAKRLAKAGSSGRRSGNILRDVVRAASAAGLMDSMAHPYSFEAPGANQQTVRIEMFLPHEIYYHMVQQDHGDVTPWCLTQEQCDADTGLGQVMQAWARNNDVQLGGGPR